VACEGIFHEYALDYAKKVNDMTGGDLKIEVLPECGIRENLAKYYGQKSAPARL